VDFSLGSDQVFHVKTSEFFESLVVVSFTQDQGAVCYADGTDENFLACKLLLIDGDALLVGAEAEIVNEHPTSWVTAAAITDSAALVCYATEVGGTVNGEEFRGAGTCNVLGVIDNTAVGAGPPNEVNSNPTEHMSLASLDAASAVLCYSDFGAGAGHCLSLSMAPTTTTTTITTTTSTTSTTTATTSTETSSTTPHTTTASSTTTETSSTTPHTTTETSTTVTETPDRSPIDSGSAPLSVLGSGAVLVLALARELVQ
jgi:cell division septation protein DedD